MDDREPPTAITVHLRRMEKLGGIGGGPQGGNLAYVSNKRRLDNSNAQMSRDNYNLNLHFAPILPDGSLGPEDNQFQYYTTTSALSPTPLREGLAFSYQATTEDARLWHIQKLDSEEPAVTPATGHQH